VSTEARDEEVPWGTRLLAPLVARMVAARVAKQHPGLGPEAIAQKMRDDLGPNPDPRALRLVQEVAKRLPQAEPVAHEPASGPDWRSPSSLVLVAANLVPLYGVLALGWPVFPLVLLFWLENVVVGTLNALRMLLVDPRDLASWAGKLFMVPFFCFHYGMFTFVHGVFVFALFGGGRHLRLEFDAETARQVLDTVVDSGVAPAAAALAASHLFSFLWNYLWRGEFRRASVSRLMMQPYGRIVVLHVGILFGGFAVMTLGSPVWALVLLVALKTGFDVRAHLKEHRRAA
jgi:Family of unknown function (DUF6498)